MSPDIEVKIHMGEADRVTVTGKNLHKINGRRLRVLNLKLQRELRRLRKQAMEEERRRVEEERRKEDEKQAKKDEKERKAEEKKQEELRRLEAEEVTSRQPGGEREGEGKLTPEDYKTTYKSGGSKKSSSDEEESAETES